MRRKNSDKMATEVVKPEGQETAEDQEKKGPGRESNLVRDMEELSKLAANGNFEVIPQTVSIVSIERKEGESDEDYNTRGQALLRAKDAYPNAPADAKFEGPAPGVKIKNAQGALEIFKGSAENLWDFVSKAVNNNFKAPARQALVNYAEGPDNAIRLNAERLQKAGLYKSLTLDQLIEKIKSEGMGS